MVKAAFESSQSRIRRHEEKRAWRASREIWTRPVGLEE